MKKFDSELIKKAHKFTKMYLKWNPMAGLDYKIEFGIIVKELLEGHELDLLLVIANGNQIDWNEWNKYGKNRIYFSTWENRHKYGYGFYDLDNKEYVLENRYTVQHNLYEAA